MDSGSIAVLVSSVLAIASTVFGAKWSQGKSKANQLLKLLNDIIAAAEDDKVSEEEFQKIVADAKELVGSGS